MLIVGWIFARLPFIRLIIANLHVKRLRWYVDLAHAVESLVHLVGCRENIVVSVAALL